MSATVVAWVLGVLLVLAGVGLALLGREVARVRAHAASLQRELDDVAGEQDSRPNPRAVQAAGMVVRTMVETATRVRDHGVGGMLLASMDDFTRWALEDRPEIVRIAAADGTVTFFFSDIENSTAINSELGDARWVALLSAHDALVTTYLDKHRGHVVKTQGDGYMVVFSNPQRAVDASLDIQRALSARYQRSRQLRRTPIRVRIGLHTGTAIEREGDFFGSDVAMAARVAALADGGEVLVSDSVREAMMDPDEGNGPHHRVEFLEAGESELKGLPGRHRLWLVEER